MGMQIVEKYKSAKIHVFLLIFIGAVVWACCNHLLRFGERTWLLESVC